MVAVMHRDEWLLEWGAYGTRDADDQMVVGDTMPDLDTVRELLLPKLREYRDKNEVQGADREFDLWYRLTQRKMRGVMWFTGDELVCLT